MSISHVLEMVHSLENCLCICVHSMGTICSKKCLNEYNLCIACWSYGAIFAIVPEKENAAQ